MISNIESRSGRFGLWLGLAFLVWFCWSGIDTFLTVKEKFPTPHTPDTYELEPAP